jgi:hypothetical protein
MSHYDARTGNRALGPGVFTLADARGNNPHGTRETADDEGRRRNAGRYETVGQLDAALDRRMHRAPPLGETAPILQSSPSFVGAILLVAVGAAIAYVATRPKPLDLDADTPEPVGPPQPLVQNPAPSATPAPVVVVAPVVANPAPAPVEPKRRRRRATAATKAT